MRLQYILRTLLPLLLLAACVGGGQQQIIRPTAANFFPNTLDVAYASLQNLHIRPLDMPAFTAAGFHALNLPNGAANPRDGNSVGRALAANWRGGDPQDAVETFLEAGLAATLGDIRFTSYFNPAELRGFAGLIRGVPGVGVQVDVAPQGLAITGVRPNSPAARANVQVGSTILEVNGQQLSALSTVEERALTLHGPVGGRVTLLIQSGSTLRQVTLRRVLQTLNQFQTASRLGDVGYIPLQIFDARAASYIRQSYATLRQEGPVTSLILDLRDNGGGALSQAQEILDLFLPSGTPLFLVGNAETQVLWRAQRRAHIPADLPLVVLINGNSASASELVASTLQDQERAVIVGARSFGKGSRQTLIPLPNGGALSLTDAFINRSSGMGIARIGVTPDICVRAFSRGDQAVRASLGRRLPGTCAPSTTATGQDIRMAEAILGNAEAYAAALTQ